MLLSFPPWPQARGRPQYCANVAMKINAKLDGVNSGLPVDILKTVMPWTNDPYIVFGALCPKALQLTWTCFCLSCLLNGSWSLAAIDDIAEQLTCT